MRYLNLKSIKSLSKAREVVNEARGVSRKLINLSLWHNTSTVNPHAYIDRDFGRIHIEIIEKNTPLQNPYAL